MTRHHCLGLWACTDHPRWSVLQLGTGAWAVIPPYRIVGEERPTHAEAIRHATTRARIAQLAAVESQPNEVCS